MRYSKIKKTAKYNYFLSYIIIVLVLVGISTALYFSASAIMRSASIMENEGCLRSIKYEIDENFRVKKRLAVEISVDDDLKDFCKIGQKEIDNDPYLIYSAVQIFSKYADNMSEGTYLYSGKSKTVITADGAENYTDYLRNMYKSEYLRQINVALNDNKAFELLYVETIEGITNILFVYEIELGNFDGRKGKVVIPIDVGNFSKQVSAITHIYKSGKCYIDCEDFAINPMNSEIYQINTPSHKKEITWKDEGKNKIAALKSDVVDISYITVVSEAELFKNARKMNILIFVNIVLMLLLGIVLTLFLVKRNMKPIKKLISVLGDMGLETDNVQNEFDFIQNVVYATVKEKEEIGEIVDKQNKTLKKSFLQGLLRGRFNEKISINDSFKTFNIKPISNKFCVCVFYVKNPEHLFLDEEGMSIEEKQRLTSIIMGNILEELIGENHLAFFVETRDVQACIINVHPKREDIFYEDLEEAIHSAKINIKNYFSIDFTAAVGNVYSSVKYISNSYDEAMQTMNYKMVVGVDGIFKYSDISGYEDESRSFSVEAEKEFISAIKCGKEEKALELLGEIIDINLQTKKLPGQEVVALMINITATVLKAIDMAKEGSRQEYFNRINDILQMIGNCKIEYFKEKTGQIVISLCREMKREIKVKNGSLGEKAMEFINENYFEDGINASAVADKLGVHAAYLSKVFKEQVGIGVLDYINTTRIEKAKEILVNSNMSIEEVSGAVGILSTRTFARLFKKYEGMAPGEYRQAIK